MLSFKTQQTLPPASIHSLSFYPLLSWQSWLWITWTCCGRCCVSPWCDRSGVPSRPPPESVHRFCTQTPPPSPLHGTPGSMPPRRQKVSEETLVRMSSASAALFASAWVTWSDYYLFQSLHSSLTAFLPSPLLVFQAKAKGQSAKVNINSALVEDIISLDEVEADMRAVLDALKDDFTRNLSIRTTPGIQFISLACCLSFVSLSVFSFLHPCVWNWTVAIQAKKIHESQVKNVTLKRAKRTY